MHLNIWSDHVTHLCCMNKELEYIITVQQRNY